MRPESLQMQIMNFRCPPHLRAALASLADERRESVSALVRAALASYIAAPPAMRRGHADKLSTPRGSDHGAY
jgi:predicted transcriptional regulator